MDANQSQLKTLLADLLQEPFAKENHFETTSLESIGKFLEDSKEKWSSDENEELRFSFKIWD
jgi:hypothetical protein